MTTKVLLVDDEPRVLEAIVRNLEDDEDLELRIATGGEAGLAILAKHPDVAVVISDMRMPGMDGAVFLKRVHDAAPTAARVLLTGQSDLQDAARAVNEAGLFRFLLKPCPTETLRATIHAAAQHAATERAERDVLERTLGATLHVLEDVLQLSAPALYRPAPTARRVARVLAQKFNLAPCWELDAAAMLHPIGQLGLPEALVSRARQGARLIPQESAAWGGYPGISEEIVSKIPRMETVAALLGALDRTGRSDPPADRFERMAAILRVAVATAELVHGGVNAAGFPRALGARLLGWDATLIGPVMTITDLFQDQVIEVKVAQLRAGQHLVSDVRAPNGSLLAAAGGEVTQPMIDRLLRFSAGLGVVEPIRVRTSGTAGAS